MLATLAGAAPTTAGRLAASMAALQFSIGALNDLRDAPMDAGRKARKPIPRGMVGEGTARFVVMAGAGAGLLLAAWAGPAALIVAAVGLAVGYLYDLGLKGTALGWLPFCLGIPLVPVFAWVGATGGIPGSFVVLVPLGAIAGAAIAVANALADVERDRSAGVASVATRLGARAAWRTAALLDLAFVAGALITGGASTWLGGAPSAAVGAPSAASLALAAGVAFLFAGLLIGRPRADPSRRELGWEVQAAGVGLIGTGWLLAAARIGTGG